MVQRVQIGTLHLISIWVEVKGLTHGGIRIGTTGDKLLWMYDNQLGVVTAKKAYEGLLSLIIGLSWIMILF